MEEHPDTKPLLFRSTIHHESSKHNAVKRFRHCLSVPSSSSIPAPRPGSCASTPANRSLFEDVPPSFMWVGLVFAIYLGAGAICFLMINDQMEGQKTNDIVDALYFCIVTMTTVGYGDLVPSSSLAKLFSCVFVFSGMVVVGFVLSKAANYLVEKQELLVVKALYGNGKVGRAAMHREFEMNRAKHKFIVTALVMLLLIAIGILFLFEFEKLSFLDAFYCVCSTITTLGYGDKSFSTKGGRIFAILWILAGTICLAQFFLYLAEMLIEQKQRVIANMVLKRRMTFVDLHSADLDYDGSVSAAEFVLYKLKEIGKISQDDIAPVLDQFKVLDIDNSGSLTMEDLVISESMEGL